MANTFRYARATVETIGAGLWPLSVYASGIAGIGISVLGAILYLGALYSSFKEEDSMGIAVGLIVGLIGGSAFLLLGPGGLAS